MYFAFHGSKRHIMLGDDQRNLSLENIAEECDGALTDKIVHFGSCSTFNIKEAELRRFKKETGAKYVSGFTTDVDFVDSAVLEIVYFDWLMEYERVGYVDSRLKNDYPGLYERLGFRMV